MPQPQSLKLTVRKLSFPTMHKKSMLLISTTEYHVGVIRQCILTKWNYVKGKKNAFKRDFLILLSHKRVHNL